MESGEPDSVAEFVGCGEARNTTMGWLFQRTGARANYEQCCRLRQSRGSIGGVSRSSHFFEHDRHTNIEDLTPEPEQRQVNGQEIGRCRFVRSVPDTF